MMRKVKIQPAQPEQIPCLQRLPDNPSRIHGRSNCLPKRLLLLYQNLDSDGRHTIDRLSGLQQLGAEQSVDDLAVSPAWRGQQITTQLLEAAHQAFPNCDFILEVRESIKRHATYTKSLAIYKTVTANVTIRIHRKRQF